jgi:hypothetical protein
MGPRAESLASSYATKGKDSNLGRNRVALAGLEVRCGVPTIVNELSALLLTEQPSTLPSYRGPRHLANAETLWKRGHYIAERHDAASERRHLEPMNFGDA